MAETAPAAGAATVVKTDVTELPAQLEEISREVVQWIRTDSISAAVGVGEAVIIYLVLATLRSVVRRLLGPIAPVTTLKGIIQRIARQSKSFFLAALAAWTVSHLVSTPPGVGSAIDAVFTIAAIVQGAIWVRVLLLAGIERHAAVDEDAATIESAMGIIKILINAAVWVIAFIVILDNLGVNVTGLIAGLGVGGIAIGLAAQGIFADLFAALSILFDRPFRVGDSISFGNPPTVGTVEAIGLKTTRVRAVSGEQVIISNTNLLNQQIANLRRIEERRVVHTVFLSLATPAEQLLKVPEMARDAADDFALSRFDRAHVSNISLDAIEVEIVYHVTVADYNVLMDARQSMLIRLIEALRVAGIDLAERVVPPGQERALQGEPAAAKPATTPKPKRPPAARKPR